MSEATVATFNIRHGRGRDGRVNLVRTAASIRATRADLIALQEVDRFSPRSDGADQPEELERLTGLRFTFLPTVIRGDSEYGIALGYHGSLESVEGMDLPRVAGEEPRRMLAARWKGLPVFATHLAVERDANLVQQGAVAEAIGGLGPGTILLGDLNSPRRRLVPQLVECLRPVRVRGRTVDPWWRFRQIDHVLLGRSLAPGAGRVVPSRASDHRPVVVSFRWRVEDVLGVTYDA